MSEKPEQIISLELLNKFMSPEFQNKDRREIANRLKDQFMKDPELLAGFERLLGKHTGLAHVAPTTKELQSFGWTEQEIVACPAAVVAAAAATWAAAAAHHGPK